MSVCEKHGEYVRDGETCRWCVDAGAERFRRDVEVITGRSLPVGGEPWEYRLEPESPSSRDVYGESPCAAALADVRVIEKYMGEPKFDPMTLLRFPFDHMSPWLLRLWMRPLFSTLVRYSTPEGIASHNAFWEGKLAEQHASARWERVARRWEAKGPRTLLDVALLWGEVGLRELQRHTEMLARTNPLLDGAQRQEPP